jgi:hypothetical protein
LATPVAFGQTQTKESAHGFLANVINKGSTKMLREVDAYVSYVGGDCNSKLVLAYQQYVGNDRFETQQRQIGIDWSSVSVVEWSVTNE